MPRGQAGSGRTLPRLPSLEVPGGEEHRKGDRNHDGAEFRPLARFRTFGANRAYERRRFRTHGAKGAERSQPRTARSPISSAESKISNPSSSSASVMQSGGLVMIVFHRRKVSKPASSSA